MRTEGSLNDGVISLTAEAIPGFTGKIADDLAILGFPGTARRSLEDFLIALHGEQSVLVVAFVSATARIPGPDLIAHVLVGTPSEEEIEHIGGHHDRFSLALRKAAKLGYYGTELHIAGLPISSAESFRANLASRFGVGSSAGVIAVATLIRS